MRRFVDPGSKARRSDGYTAPMSALLHSDAAAELAARFERDGYVVLRQQADAARLAAKPHAPRFIRSASAAASARKNCSTNFSPLRPTAKSPWMEVWAGAAKN